MNNLNLAAMALWAGLSMSCSPKTSTVKGVICDATMNTLTIVTEANDTLSFGTANAEKTATKSWTAAPFLPADMPGTWRTTTRRTYV